MLDLITDRTLSDVARVKELAAKWIAGTITDDEKAEFLAGLKGAYNYTDLNRVETATKYINDYLNNLQSVLDEYRENLYVAADTFWLVPFLPLYLTHKLDWAMEDEPSVSDLARYLGNVAAVTDRISIEKDLPDTMGGLTHTGANNIEKALETEYQAAQDYEANTKQLITNTAAAYFFSGDLFGGEV